MVAYFPPTDVRPWVADPMSPYFKNYPALRFDVDKAADYSPVLQVSADDPPTLLISGDKDTLVPLEHSEKILAQLKDKHVPCELLVIPGAGHGFQGADGKRAGEATIAWFRKYLVESAAVGNEPPRGHHWGGPWCKRGYAFGWSVNERTISTGAPLVAVKDAGSLASSLASSMSRGIDRPK